LEDEKILKQFEAIENRLENLIHICREKEAQNRELISRVDKLEEELRTKVEAEKKALADKELIRNRIDHLLKRLEDITGVQED
jgi:hypothetical protein